MDKELQDRITAILSEKKELSDELLYEIVDQTLQKSTQNASDKLQALLTQREKLELEIRQQTQQLQETRQDAFSFLEAALRNRFADIDSHYMKRLTQLKLESIDILDLLTEIIESAFISALENGENIEASFKEITRDLTFKTLRDGYLSLDRARHVITTVVAVSSDMAEATPNMAEEILRGALYGAKKGLTQSIHVFKERFDFIPEEPDSLQIKTLQQAFLDLQHTDKLFIQIIQEQSRHSATIVSEKMMHIVENMRPDLSDLISASKETLNVISERLTKLGKKAVLKGEKVLQSKAAIEAKRMGVTVWHTAKGAIGGAITSAKDAIDKKQSKK